MLRFEKLAIENFGPFKGEQLVDFGSQNGVTIIWGDNGRGKTTLLNVFRYALFGHIKDRQGAKNDYLSLCNIEASQAGDYHFRIVLKMNDGENRYELTRHVHLRNGILSPKNNEDFIEDCYLKKNGNFLSASDRARELQRIMPSDISRFFLFDGELLQEYETLLDSSSNDGRLIRESIEKILGMPVLANGASDIVELVKEYIRIKNKAAQADKNTAEYASQITTLLAQIEGHETELKRLQAELANENAKLKDIKQRMSNSEKLRALLQDESNAKLTCEKLEIRRTELVSELQTAMKTAWQHLAKPVVHETIDSVRAEIALYQEKKSAASASQSILEELEKAIKSRKCGVCSQTIPSSLAAELDQKLAVIKAATPVLSVEDYTKLSILQTRLTDLQSLNLIDNSNIIKSKVQDLNKVEIEIATTEQTLHALRKQISSFGEFDREELTITLARDFSQCTARITTIEAGIVAEQNAINEATARRKRLDELVSRLAKDKDVISAAGRLATCEKIEKIFTLGMEQYRVRLKNSVEADASQLFVNMSADKDYDRLQINDGYGLEIIHKDGIKVPSRSAGFEHIVALSLIGALHKNAPLQGPVIMDSPFGRLSSNHERNVAACLPTLSDQVIILVHDRELDPTKTRELLGGNLLYEYRLERITSFHTQIIS